MILISCFIVLIFTNVGISEDSDPYYKFTKREFSLSKPYSGNGMKMPFWDFRDNVMLTNNFIRLTSNRQGQRGSIWNKFPCHLRDWEMHVQFQIHGGGRTLAADGIALWYTKDRMIPGPVFGNQDNFVGLGVFLDTYKNSDQAITFPLISAMVFNGSSSYDHANDGKKDAIGSCKASLRNKDHETSILVRYANQVLTISVDVDGTGEWRDCIESDQVVLPTGYYFGISAATGDLADNHDILNIKFFQLDVARSQDQLIEDWATILPKVIKTTPSAIDSKDESANSKSSSYSFRFFFVLLCIFLIVCLLIIAGLFLLKKRQERNRKRFY